MKRRSLAARVWQRHWARHDSRRRAWILAGIVFVILGGFFDAGSLKFIGWATVVIATQRRPAPSARVRALRQERAAEAARARTA